jgi:hypothetical protein
MPESNDATSDTVRVCPRCGTRVADSRWCRACGLNLRQHRELATAETAPAEREVPSQRNDVEAAHEQLRQAQEEAERQRLVAQEEQQRRAKAEAREAALYEQLRRAEELRHSPQAHTQPERFEELPERVGRQEQRPGTKGEEVRISESVATTTSANGGKRFARPRMIGIAAAVGFAVVAVVVIALVVGAGGKSHQRTSLTPPSNPPTPSGAYYGPNCGQSGLAAEGYSMCQRTAGESCPVGFTLKTASDGTDYCLNES